MNIRNQNSNIENNSSELEKNSKYSKKIVKTKNEEIQLHKYQKINQAFE